MTDFTLEKIHEIRGKIEFFKLFKDGKCEFDEFIKGISVDGNLKSELRTIQTRMQLCSECKTIPEKKQKDITPKNDPNKEYEIRTANLRVYTFHDKSKGRIIVCGGKKGNQKHDLRHFRQMKKDYFDNTPRKI